MRALTTMVAILSPALALAGWTPVEGNGQVETQTRALRGFSELELDAPVDVFVQQGDFSVKVTIDSNLQPLLETRVEGARLKISVKERIRPDRRARIELTLPELRAVDLNASGDLEARGMTAADRISIGIHGSGDVHFEGTPSTFELGVHGSGEVEAEFRRALRNAKVAIHGSGDVQLRGPTTERLAISIHGSGDVDARKLPAGESVVSVNGSGSVRTTVDGKGVFAVNGSGDIEWSGEAAIRKAISGSGTIRRAH